MEGMPKNSSEETKGNGYEIALLILVSSTVIFCIAWVIYKCCKKRKKGSQYQAIDNQESETERLRRDKEELRIEIERLRRDKEELRIEIDMRKTQYKLCWRKAALYADWRKEEFEDVPVTLDADTAHPALLLSQQRRVITWQKEDQDLADIPQRFSSLPCVLGQQGITSGRCFWEVDIANTVSYDLGICRDNVTRKGRVTMSPQNGFWAIRLYNMEYWALTAPETCLTLREYPCSVGIFLDYEAGDVSFYNMTDGSHIFSFSQNTFQGVLRPFFRLWDSDSGSLTVVH